MRAPKTGIFSLCAIAALAAATLSACAPRPGSDPADARPRVVDLGHSLSATDPTWSGQPVFSYTAAASFARDGYFAGRFSTDEHFGTHVDAPAHFSAQGLTVDRLPPDSLVRPGRRLDISTQAAADADYRLTLADIQAFERQHGPINAGDIVLVATGWDQRWPDAARYRNETNGVKHFPGLSVEAAAYLGSDRRVAGIGIDTPSIDYGPSTAFEAHKTTMPAGVYHIENMTGLTALPAGGFTVVVAPIKIAGGSGGPARVFALIK